jgi:hypothetical protein
VGETDNVEFESPHLHHRGLVTDQAPCYGHSGAAPKISAGREPGAVTSPGQFAFRGQAVIKAVARVGRPQDRHSARRGAYPSI